MAPMVGLRALVCAAALGAVVLSQAPAAAGEGQDIVFLANGGRLRGTVFEEDPVKGVTIKLLDGTTRTVAPKEVQRVQYGPEAGGAAPVPAPAPAPTMPTGPAAAPGAPLTPVGAAPYVYTGGDSATRPARRRRSTGLMVTGIVLSGLGVIALGAGGTLFGFSIDGKTCESSYYDSYYGYTRYSYNECDDEDMQTAGIGLLIGGGVALGAGLFMTIFGASKKGGSAMEDASNGSTAPAASPVPDVRVGLGNATLRWAF